MKRLRVTDFGPIREADVKFGDLTVLVGPQASGKSLFVQLYKLIEDAPVIAGQLMQYGFDWHDEKDPVGTFSSLYFGGGLEGIFGKTTQIRREGRRIDPKKMAKPSQEAGKETVFLIPAQRVLVLQDRWPRPFMAYRDGDPYAIRQFSESIRTFMLLMGRLAVKDLLLVPEFVNVVNASIYGSSMHALKREGAHRQVVLKQSAGAPGLPYSVWSAGQREFTPLLLGLSSFKSTWALDKHMTTAILEEPEMGLHPQAIIATGLLIFELLALNLRVIISTHSPVILDLVWAIRQLSSLNPTVAVDALCKIFNIQKVSPNVRVVLMSALSKIYHTYFFNRTDSGVITQDISSLDSGSEDENVAGWGGLSGFSGRIARIVGEAASR